MQTQPHSDDSLGNLFSRSFILKTKKLRATASGCLSSEKKGEKEKGEREKGEREKSVSKQKGKKEKRVSKQKGEKEKSLLAPLERLLEKDCALKEHRQELHMKKARKSREVYNIVKYQSWRQKGESASPAQKAHFSYLLDNIKAIDRPTDLPQQQYSIDYDLALLRFQETHLGEAQEEKGGKSALEEQFSRQNINRTHRYFDLTDNAFNDVSRGVDQFESALQLQSLCQDHQLVNRLDKHALNDPNLLLNPKKTREFSPARFCKAKFLNLLARPKKARRRVRFQGMLQQEHRSRLRRIVKRLLFLLKVLEVLNLDLADMDKVAVVRPFQAPESQRFLEGVKTDQQGRVSSMLRKHKVLVLQYDHQGNTGLHWACKRGLFDMAVLLLTVAGYLSWENHLQLSPLFYAARKLDEPMVRLLLFFGAVPEQHTISQLDHMLLVSGVDKHTRLQVITIKGLFQKQLKITHQLNTTRRLNPNLSRDYYLKTKRQERSAFVHKMPMFKQLMRIAISLDKAL